MDLRITPAVILLILRLLRLVTSPWEAHSYSARASSRRRFDPGHPGSQACYIVQTGDFSRVRNSDSARYSVQLAILFL
jgi:hypothetical protein